MPWRWQPGEGYAPSIGLIALIDDVVSSTRFAAASFDGDAIPRSLTVVVRTHEDAKLKGEGWGREA